MRGGKHRRQLLLFLTAIALPAAVLIGLAARIISQEKELAVKRATDERRNALEQLRRELAVRLEAIKLQEMNRLIRTAGQGWADVPENPAVVFVARLESDRLVLPWDAASSAPVAASAQFLRLRQEGELREFVKKDYRAATESYRMALESARQPAERAAARLLVARTLAKAGDGGQASQQYLTLLKEGGVARDEEGIAFRLYAAERLIEAQRYPEMVRQVLVREVQRGAWLTVPEMYLVRSLLASVSGERDGKAREKLSLRIGQVEQALELNNGFSRVRARIESAASSGPVWIPYGKEPWLITVTPPSPPLPGLLLAVSSSRAAPPGVKLGGRELPGDTLGESFPGVRVKWPGNRFDDAGRRSNPLPLYLAGLGLMLGLTILAGYLLLRDVNRDMRLTEVRSQFVASVSHELKTPLTSIRMFAETLALGRAKDERTHLEYLETIVNESERLARLVDNVLDFSKIEQGKKMYRLRRVSMAGVADSAARAMQYPLSQQGFKLRLEIQEDLPSVRADPDAIEQAILNLLTNAMKFSGDAREIDLRLAARNGDAVIEVTDRGLGIAPEEQKHVFEKFYRAPSHESHLIAGTGLGLTLVAHIAKAHGGRVEVHSEPGAGSTFSILIPMEGQA